MASWLITFGIIFINGFFVAAEFALVKVRWSQLDVLIQQWNGKARMIKMVTENLDNYLSACQLGITIASLALGWVWEPLIASQFVSLNNYYDRWLNELTIHTISVSIAFFLITTLHIVIGEQAPKSFAIRDPLATSQWIILPLYRFHKLLKPLIWFLNTLSLGFLRLFWINHNTEELSHSEEELRMIVIESEEDGQINASERELIHNVFDFDNRQVCEIMTPSHKVFAIDREDRWEDTVKRIIVEGFSRVPVYEWGIDNIIWRILLKDVVSAHFTWSNLDLDRLLRPIQFVAENMKIIDCLRLLQISHIHIALATSEYGSVIWLVTMEDILEELVWDIHDEGDEYQTIVHQLEDGWLMVDATATVSDVNELLPHELTESDKYDTVAGLLNILFGRIPSINESIISWNYKLTVIKRKKQRVDQVKLELIPNL